MTHALAEPLCACPCHEECGPPLQAATRTAELALAAAGEVADTVDPYPFFKGEALLGITVLAQKRECEYPGCGRTVRGPLIPVLVGGVMRKVGRGCARKTWNAERAGLADQLMPMLPEGAE